MRSVLSYVSALALAVGMAGTAAPLAAQDETDTAETTLDEQGQTQDQTQAQGSQDQSTTASQAQSGTEQADRVVATVGEHEIRESDVTAAIEALPPGVQQTPPQMLLPAVVDQLVMRELVLEEARAQNLQDDPEVQERVDSATGDVQDQALVEVWLKRELDERVTEADIDAAVEELRAQDPAMQEASEIRPQVTQALQVQAMTEIGDELRQDAEITFYGPTGEPLEQAEQVGSGAEGETGTTTDPAGGDEAQN